MTPKEHLKEIINDFVEMVCPKYNQGVQEHGGGLWKKKNLIVEAKKEAVDLFTYLDSLEKQIEKIKEEYGIELGTEEDKDEK